MTFRRTGSQMTPMSSTLERFARTTTMHGVPKVILARSLFSRCCWSLVCITAGAIFCVQMTEVLRRFFSYPKKVTVEVVSTPVPFPSVSLCNMRNLDFYILNTLNRKFLQDPYPLSHINQSDNAFINEYMKILAKHGPMWYKYQSTHPVIFQEIFSRTTLSANIPEEIISTAAVQLDEFIVTCYFGGNACNRSRDFRTFFDPYYFNCFTYRAPKSLKKSNDEDEADDEVRELLFLSEGIENGWSTVVLTGSGMLDRNAEIRVVPGLHESGSAVSANEGVRVVIHPPGTQPFPLAEGFDVPPGHSASFGIRPRQNIRIGPPHGKCTRRNPLGGDVDDEDGDGRGGGGGGGIGVWGGESDAGNAGDKRDDISENHDTRYRVVSCQKLCIQRHVMRACGCYDASLPKLRERGRRTKGKGKGKPGAEEDKIGIEEVRMGDELKGGVDEMKSCRYNDEVPTSCMFNATDECLDVLRGMHARIQCARETRDHVTRNATIMSQCQCHPPCDEFVYDVSYSLSKWPASGYEGDAAYLNVFYVESFRERFGNTAKNSTVWDYFRDEDRETTMKNFARLNVYVADSNVIKTQETPDYEPNQLVGDIGGQLGLWVGISVITLSEVVELICECISHVMPRRCSRSDGIGGSDGAVGPGGVEDARDGGGLVELSDGTLVQTKRTTTMMMSTMTAMTTSAASHEGEFCVAYDCVHFCDKPKRIGWVTETELLKEWGEATNNQEEAVVRDAVDRERCEWSQNGQTSSKVWEDEKAGWQETTVC